MTASFVLGGRYRVLEMLGRGGMGAVVRAHDEARDESVAIKILDDTRLGDAESRARFANEAALGRRLKSAHAPRVFDVSVDPPFFVMEYLEGTTLEKTIDDGGPLAPRTAITIGLHVLEVLEELHALGYVHGDVTPGNVFLLGGRTTSARLLDLGLAAPLGTKAHAGGTTAFVSPEQARGEMVDARSDLYALSATLHRALTGELVFPTEPIGTFYELLGSAVRPPARVDAALDAVLIRGLAALPSERWATAKSYFLALSEALASPTLAP